MLFRCTPCLASTSTLLPGKKHCNWRRKQACKAQNTLRITPRLHFNILGSFSLSLSSGSKFISPLHPHACLTLYICQSSLQIFHWSPFELLWVLGGCWTPLIAIIGQWHPIPCWCHLVTQSLAVVSPRRCHFIWKSLLCAREQPKNLVYTGCSMFMALFPELEWKFLFAASPVWLATYLLLFLVKFQIGKRKPLPILGKRKVQDSFKWAVCQCWSENVVSVCTLQHDLGYDESCF